MKDAQEKNVNLAWNRSFMILSENCDEIVDHGQEAGKKEECKGLMITKTLWLICGSILAIMHAWVILDVKSKRKEEKESNFRFKQARNWETNR